MTDAIAKRDIHNLKEVVTFGFNGLKFGKSLFVGGQFQFAALGGVIAIYPSAVAAFADFGDVIPEIQDLDESEIAELSAHVISLGAIEGHAAQVVAESLKAAVEIRQAVASVNNLLKLVKA